MKYSKGLYYDGHNQPDVLDYRQKHFLPAMQQYWSWMVEYKIEEVETELTKQLQAGERRIVLVAHDESIMQANDGETEGWVMNGEELLRKKGARRRLHQSDVICSTYVWLKGASVTMDKNYVLDRGIICKADKWGYSSYITILKSLAASWEDHFWIWKIAWFWVSGFNYSW